MDNINVLFVRYFSPVDRVKPRHEPHYGDFVAVRADKNSRLSQGLFAHHKSNSKNKRDIYIYYELVEERNDFSSKSFTPIKTGVKRID